MLIRESSQIKADTFDDIFKFDASVGGELRSKAACDKIRHCESVQETVCTRMNEDLDKIEKGLTGASFIEMSAIRMQPVSNLNVASG